MRTFSDIAQLAAELTDYLEDHGAWGVGSGGPETVTDIAEFIGDWFSRGHQEQTAAPILDRPFCMPEYRRQESSTQVIFK